jgi:hypothetical protein
MHGMATDMAASMECRGFTGTYRAPRAAGLRPADCPWARSFYRRALPGALPLLADCLLVTAFFLMGA